ncbi:MAG: cupin domain-containing protein, partial [Pseudomonadota bacterium]
RANFDQRVLLHTDDLDWVESPMAGVDRRMLDRIGDEVARATTIVRYAPGSHFSAHVHSGGEEFIVLDGVFQDEHGDFSAGSYVRNPPESSHTPGSEKGCVIFVKLWQFDLQDRESVRLRFEDLDLVADPDRSGVQSVTLFRDHREFVRLERYAPDTNVDIDAKDGMELLVLDGDLCEAGDSLHRNSWLRCPIGYRAQVRSGSGGTLVWVKSGHLPYASAPPTC